MKFLQIICISVMSIILVSCNIKGNTEPNILNSTKPTSSVSTQNLTTELTTEYVSPEEKENKDFLDYINRIDSKNIKSLEIKQLNPGNGQQIVYSCDKIDVIDKWILLLKKIETTVVPFESSTGVGFSLTLNTVDGAVLEIGGFIDSYVYSSNVQTMKIIQNYKDLENEFKAAKKAVSEEIK